MYEKILVTLDGSRQSECIIDHVRVLARSCETPQVILLRVVEPYLPSLASEIGDTQAAELQKNEFRAAEEYLSYVADTMRTHCEGVETVVLEGHSAHEILEYADSNGVDLIAMSTHGKSGILRWAVGSVTRHVMDHWAGPLLTVPPAGCRL